jgi:recombination protein RecA
MGRGLMAKKKTGKKKDKKTEAATLEQMRKSLGLSDNDDTVMPANEFESVKAVTSTGHENLDEIISPVYYEQRTKGDRKGSEESHPVTAHGGVPRGYLGEFYGPNQGGKSSLCLKLAAKVTQAKEYVLWIDAEGSFQNEFAMIHGVDLKYVILGNKPGKTAEDYLEMVINGAAKGLFSLVIVDSVAGLQPKKILDCDLEKDAKIGEMARLMSRACPQILNAAKKGNCSVIFINQIRMKIGGYGNPETTPGGEALRFYSSLRLRVDRMPAKTRSITKNGEEIGILSKVFVTKNRFGAPYKDTFVPIYFSGEQPNPLDMLLNAALITKVIKSRTANKETKISFAPHFKSEPIDNLKEMMNPDLIRAIAAAQSEISVLDPEVQSFVDNVDDFYGDVLED